MKVFTQSEKAISGQKATMEFLLINHPLDCPICDQGGECELQDLAMGYGGDVSQYVERKRVVRDKDIGPLVQTDMTRCIHCTRCVRFGEEVAGLRELGATGRGEHMEIGTYVQHAMTSELSGNVIDLCPVGALTSKPYRYSARAWELQSRPGVAPHDCIGSNLHIHAKGQVVKRVVPRDNDAVNETWISDRDRFSYEGLRHPDRLLSPKVKLNGVWQDCDWDTAFRAAREALAEHGDQLGALASPSSTTEEFLLLQRLVRGLGSPNVDYRLRQLDFSADAAGDDAATPGFSLDALSCADAVCVIGGYPRHDQPLLHHRLRQAALRGAKVMVVDVLGEDYNLGLACRLQVKPGDYPGAIAAIWNALDVGATVPGVAPSGLHRQIAEALRTASRSVVLVANEIERHPARGRIAALARSVADATQSVCVLLGDGANAAGARLAGAASHLQPGAKPATTRGAGALRQFQQKLPAYLLLGIEPDADCASPREALDALRAAKSVVALTPFSSPVLLDVATVMLPTAIHAENEGTFINLQGDRQTFRAAVKAPGEARPAWKILRVLGESLGLDGFDAVGLDDVSAEVAALAFSAPSMPAAVSAGLSDAGEGGLQVHLTVPMYSTDGLTRRAASLQRQPQCADEKIRVSPATLSRLGLMQGARARLDAAGVTLESVVEADARVPDDVVWLQFGSALAREWGGALTCSLTAAAGVSA